MVINMNYKFVKFLIEKVGKDKFLELFNKVVPGFDLYSFGTAWLDDSEYILKFRGTNGDLIINWGSCK